MARNRSSFGDAASKGLKESYEKHFSPDISERTETSISKTEISNNTQGVNPYYDYHPKTGQKGGTLGRPRQNVKRTQISIGCTEEEKDLYRRVAIADNRKLPDLINRAIMEYIENHGLSDLF